MHSSKSFIVSLYHSFCRLISCALWQLPWLTVVVGGAWWFKLTLPAAIQTHFGLDQAKENLDLSTSLAKAMKGTASFTNPSAFVSYLGALFEKTNASAKYTAIQMTASTAEAIVIWALDLIIVLALIYAVIRIYKAWRADTKTYEMTQTIINQLTPHIGVLQKEIITLRQEIKDLKNELNNKK